LSHLPDQSADWKPRGRSDILARSTEDQRTLYDRARDKIHVLNETAEYIWHLCDGKHSVADIVEQVGHEFDIPDAVNVTEDVDRVLESMLRLDLLVAAAAAADEDR